MTSHIDGALNAAEQSPAETKADTIVRPDESETRGSLAYSAERVTDEQDVFIDDEPHRMPVLSWLSAGVIAAAIVTASVALAVFIERNANASTPTRAEPSVASTTMTTPSIAQPPAQPPSTETVTVIPTTTIEQQTTATTEQPPPSTPPAGVITAADERFLDQARSFGLTINNPMQTVQNGRQICRLIQHGTSPSQVDDIMAENVSSTVVGDVLVSSAMLAYPQCSTGGQTSIAY